MIKTKIKKEERKIRIAKEVMRRMDLQRKGLPQGHPRKNLIKKRQAVLLRQIQEMERKLKLVKSCS